MAYTILEQVKIRLGQYSTDDDGDISYTSSAEDTKLELLIEQATEDVKRKRRYPASYDDDTIEEDLENYSDVIVNLVLYDRSQAGEEFMGSYDEGGVTRSWVDRNKLFTGVYPVARVI